MTTETPSTSSMTPPPDSSSSDGGDTESTSTGTDAGFCGEGRSCVEPTPLGWEGPVAIARVGLEDDVPPCVDPYPATGLTRLEGWADPGPAVCECSCALTTADCAIGYATYTDDCTTIDESVQLNEDGCAEIAINNASVLAYAIFTGGTCDQTAEEEIAEIPWTAAVRACEGMLSDEVCDGDGRVCAEDPPEGFEQTLCVLAEGDVPCPDGDYSEKFLMYGGADDSRNCSNCSCTPPTFGTPCLDQIDYHTSDDCSDAAAGSLNNQECVNNLTLGSINFDLTQSTCAVVSGGEPTGEVVPNDPYTYCCAP